MDAQRNIRDAATICLAGAVDRAVAQAALVTGLHIAVAPSPSNKGGPFAQTGVVAA